MNALTQIREPATPAAASSPGHRLEVVLAVAAFAILCVVVLTVAPQLVEPDDYAYRASIVAITQAHFLTLSSAQYHALSAQLASTLGGLRAQAAGPGGGIPGIAQWVRLSDGRWISEKDPGYPFLAAPFQALGIIRLAPLCYGALACLGLFAGARRWLGRYGGTAAVVLFCSSGAAMLFAWRDYMPTFTDASLIAAATGALLWAVLATDATPRRRTWAGLAGFVAIEAAVFVRYTNVVVLVVAVVAVIATWRLTSVRLPGRALAWWLGSAVVFGAGVAVFDSLVYGGPLTTGYRSGEIRFSLSAIGPNLRYLPPHLLQAMPVLLLGLVAAAWIIGRWMRLRRAGGAAADAARDDLAASETAAVARRDLGVGIVLAASWFGVWGLYAAYTWTANPGLNTLQSARFYLPAAGAIALLGAWLVVRVARRVAALARLPRPAPTALAIVTSAAVAAAVLGAGAWSFSDIRGGGIGGVHGPGRCSRRAARRAAGRSAGPGRRPARASQDSTRPADSARVIARVLSSPPALPHRRRERRAVRGRRRVLTAQPGRQVGRARAAGPRRVGRVGDRAPVQRQAAAADAGVEPVAQRDEGVDLVVEPIPPAARQPRPVGPGRRPPGRQRCQRRGHLVEAQPDVPRGPDEGEPAQRAPLEPALPARCPGRGQQPEPLVVADRRAGEAAPPGDLADGQQVSGVHRATVP